MFTLVAPVLTIALGALLVQVALSALLFIVAII